MHSAQRIARWKQLPGNWDPLHSQQVFPAENGYGIPTIANDGCMPSSLIQWGSRPKLLAVKEESDTAVHFFVDDYRFESVWNHPGRSLPTLMHVGLALSPDFSLFRDMPMAMQLWNVYRNRWLGAYWQMHDIAVIPTISWSPQSYAFCYLGVETGSIVAISSVGVMREQKARILFREGFERMIEAIEPSTVLCYGPLLDIQPDIPVVTFPTRWEEHRPRRATFPMHTRSIWEEVVI